MPGRDIIRNRAIPLELTGITTAPLARPCANDPSPHHLGSILTRQGERNHVKRLDRSFWAVFLSIAIIGTIT